MGCTDSKSSYKFGSNKQIDVDENENPIYGHFASNDEKESYSNLDIKVPASKTLQQLYLTSFLLFEQSNLLGCLEHNQNDAKMSYHFKTYAQVYQDAKNLGSNLV